MPDVDTVVVCDGLPSTRKLPCSTPVWVYPRKEMCKFLQTHKTSSAVPHPASVDPAHAAASWSSNDEQIRTLETLQTQCEVYETMLALKAKGAPNSESFTAILLSMISRMLQESRAGKALATVHGIYDYYTPSILKRLGQRASNAAAYSVKWLWQHPFWFTYAAAFGRVLHTFLCLKTQGVGWEQLRKLGLKVLHEYAKPTTQLGRLLSALWELGTKCALPFMRAGITVNLWGMIWAAWECVLPSIKGLGAIGDATMQLVTYCGTWLGESTGARAAYDAVVRLMDTRQQIFAEFRNIVKVANMPYDALVLHGTFYILAQLPTTFLVWAADCLTGYGAQVTRYLVGRTFPHAAALMKDVIRAPMVAGKLIVFRDAFLSIMDMLRDICGYAVCMTSTRLGLAKGIDANCCPDVAHLVKVLMAEADFERDRDGDDGGWEQTQDDDGEFDEEAAQRRHFGDVGMIDWKQDGLVWKPVGPPLKDGL